MNRATVSGSKILLSHQEQKNRSKLFFSLLIFSHIGKKMDQNGAILTFLYQHLLFIELFNRVCTKLLEVLQEGNFLEPSVTLRIFKNGVCPPGQFEN